ncbi:MAG: histidinol dehydrogenase [Proteobacteria bacterium]|jgi:histidinol dehydrogenase|nr:histidinol dehydrogenase [Pseudomonadota bacterium]
MIARLDSQQADFDAALSGLLTLPSEDRLAVRESVRRILEQVRTRGDLALLELTVRFDQYDVASAADLEISLDDQRRALGRIDPLVRDALQASVNRVRLYHQKQKAALGGGADWEFTDATGTRLGQRIRAMERVGIYAPGGKAAYPSTVIMTAIPARVAGVKEIILVAPTPRGEISDVLLAAACLAGVDRFFTIGGAQAIGALAWGTETVPRVDKIVGPGNIYVATAKELVYGVVGVDMIAGPSEVVIIADDSARPEWLVMDLFAQAEHDELAQAIIVSPDRALLDAIPGLLETHLADMPRRDIIERSLADRGALIGVQDLAEAARVVNRIAPEHLELAIRDPAGLMPAIRHAGAIFLGQHTAEVVGDYTAGPSHVLPTNGSARFASALGVYDFQVRSSVVQCSREGAISLSRDAAIIAREEGLSAHAASAECRVEG